MSAPTAFNHRILGKEDAPPLVFLHGFLGDVRDWHEIAESFAEDFRCIAVDLPGHGKTPVSQFRHEDDLSSVARALFCFLDALDIDSCSIVGYSMGGRLALCMALMEPKRVARLVLESASPGLRSEDERQRRAEDDRRLERRLLESDFAAFIEEWYAQPMFASMRDSEYARRQARFRAFMDQRLENDPEQLARALRLMSVARQPSLWQEWAKSRTPTLLLAGERDSKFRAIASDMAALRQDADTKVLASCGHNLHFEEPEAYVRELMRFLPKAVVPTARH